MENVSRYTVFQVLSTRYNGFICLSAVGTTGGIIVVWQTNMVTVTNPRVDAYSVTAFFYFADGGDWWHRTVYGPTLDELKPFFLQEPREIHDTCIGMWTMAGDFNLILAASHKNQGMISRQMMGRFRRFVNDMELAEAPLSRRRYSMSNKRVAPMLVKLDRWLYSAELDAAFPNSLLHALSSSISDHCAIQMSTNVKFQSRRRFHFECFWPKQSGFMEVVEETWNAP
jgi:hypothetical protein